MSVDGNAWFSPRDLAADAPVRLICLPHAGSGAAGFYRWKAALGAHAAVCPALLPGRESRLREPAMTDADQLVDQLVAQAPEAFDRPYVLFGHSMGALLAYGLARRLTAARPPECLIVSGRNAPQVPYGNTLLHPLADEPFLAGLAARYGNASGSLLEDPELRAIFLPILRADLQLVETFRDTPGALFCPVAALAGTDDRSVSDSGLEAWRDVTAGGFLAERLPGGHFYHLEQGQTALLALLASRLQAIARDLPRLPAR